MFLNSPFHFFPDKISIMEWLTVSLVSAEYSGLWSGESGDTLVQNRVVNARCFLISKVLFVGMDSWYLNSDYKLGVLKLQLSQPINE